GHHSFFSSRRRHTRSKRDWSSDVCSSDLTLLFPAPPVLAAHAAVGGKKESEGPLAGAFDELSRDNLFGQDNWEAAERALQLRAARLCLQKGHAAEDSVSLALAGDLQAQSTASSYAMRELGIPYA